MADEILSMIESAKNKRWSWNKKKQTREDEEWESEFPI